MVVPVRPPETPVFLKRNQVKIIDLSVITITGSPKKDEST